MKENLFCGCFVLSVEIKSGNLRSVSPQRYSSNTNIFCIIYQALRTPKYRHGYIPKGNAQYVKISKKNASTSERHFKGVMFNPSQAYPKNRKSIFDPFGFSFKISRPYRIQ